MAPSGHNLADSDVFIHQTRAIRTVENTECWVIREKRPDTLIVHCKCVHAATVLDTPHLDRLVGTGTKNCVTSIINENGANVVNMTNKLRDLVASSRIIQAHRLFWTTTRHDIAPDTQGVYRTLLSNFLALNIDLECFTGTIEIPQTDLAVEAARSDPICAHIWGRGCNTFDIIGMLAYRLDAGIILFGMWSPDFYCKGNIIDPMHMGMGLSAEFGRRLGLLVFGGGRRRIGNVATVFEVEVQVPSAYNAVSSSRVSMMSFNRIVIINGEAIHT
ncbi:hypothetical protein HG531_000301 [Fusarium graminearum]|nr:hypothetical protein HG531_000301 [Fusarium graminearum]